MGKWTKLKGKYPRLPLETDYQQKVNVVLDSQAPEFVLSPAEHSGRIYKVRELSDFQIAALYNAARGRKDELEADLKVVDLEIEAYSRLLVDRFEAAGETSKTFDGGTVLSLGDEPYPTVKDQALMMAWLKRKGLESLLTLNYQTMSSLVKNAIQEGSELPDGVDIFIKTKVTRRGGGKKGEAVHE